MTLDLTAIRTRYQDDYQPVCSGCGQPMRCILWRVFKCDGKVKAGRHWQDCPAPEQWERPNEQTRREVRGLLDLLPLPPPSPAPAMPRLPRGAGDGEVGA